MAHHRRHPYPCCNKIFLLVLVYITTCILLHTPTSAIPEEYYLEDYLYDNYYDQDYDYSGPKPGSPSSVPSSLTQKALLGQLVHVKSGKHANPTAQSAKLIPEAGWIPLADSPVGKGSNPAITFLQGAPVTPAHTVLNTQAPPVFRSHPSANSGFQQQRPTHKPIIVSQQHQPQNKGAASHHAPTKVQSTFDQLIKHNHHSNIPTKDPITINPKQDTIVIHYNSIREQRQTEPLSFDERINLLPLDCKAEVMHLIKDILEAPLRKRNSLLGMLKMKENIAKSKQQKQFQQQQIQQQQPQQFQQQQKPKKRPQKPVEQPRTKPHDVVSQTFSNFPGFQKESNNNDNEIRQPKNFRPAPTTTPRPRPAITLEPFTLPPLTEPPPPPIPQTLPPKRFVPEQIFSSEEVSRRS